MRIKMTQIGEPPQVFGSEEAYEQYLMTTSDELVHLEEYVEINNEWVPAEDCRVLDDMWDRITAKLEEDPFCAAQISQESQTDMEG